MCPSSGTVSQFVIDLVLQHNINRRMGVCFRNFESTININLIKIPGPCMAL